MVFLFHMFHEVEVLFIVQKSVPHLPGDGGKADINDCLKAGSSQLKLGKFIRRGKGAGGHKEKSSILADQ